MFCPSEKIVVYRPQADQHEKTDPETQENPPIDLQDRTTIRIAYRNDQEGGGESEYSITEGFDTADVVWEFHKRKIILKM